MIMHHYASPQPEDYWISLGTRVHGSEVWDEGDKARQALTYNTIANEVISRGYQAVLDVGCNIGAVARFLHLRGYAGDYLGVDSNRFALAVASSRGLAVRELNLRNLGALSSDHDCVIVKDVIEHLESLGPLREAFRVASRALILGLFIPLLDGPTIIQRMPDGYFHNQYNRQGVLALAGSFGFRLDKSISTPETTGTPNEVHVFVMSDTGPGKSG